MSFRAHVRMLKLLVLFGFLTISLGDAAILNRPSPQRLSHHATDESFKAAYEKAVMEFPDLKYKFGDAQFFNSYDKDDIYITFYSKSSPHGHKIDVDVVETVKNSSYDVKKPTKIILGPKFNVSNTGKMETAYLRHHNENVNVFTIYYEKFFGVEFTRYVHIYDQLTETIAKLVEHLHRYGTPLDNVHFIGFGINAHVIGGVAKLLHPYKVGRITGLDPAGGAFDQSEWLGELVADDAVFVDVILTNTRKYGTKKERGTVHFYPNGGEFQPETDDFGSHMKAKDYFEESIVTTSTFQSEDANSWSDYKAGHTLGHTTYMGEYVSKSARGKFYLDVNPTSPYSKGGKYGLKDQFTYPRDPTFEMAQKALQKPKTTFLEETLNREVNAFNAEEARTESQSGRQIYDYVRGKLD